MQRRRSSIAPRVDDTHRGDNGGGDRLYSGGPAMPVPPAVEHADYLAAFAPPAGRPEDLDKPARVPARPSRFIAQRHSGGASGTSTFLRETFTGGHGEVIRRSPSYAAAASGSGVAVVRDTRSRFLRRQTIANVAAAAAREGVSIGATGDEYAPVGTPQQEPFPRIRTERRRAPLPMWNGGAR